MAAGRGIRMKPLTNKIPKAMAPISGTTLISKGIKQIKKNIKNVHITVGYKGSMLAKHVIEMMLILYLILKAKKMDGGYTILF